MVMVVRRTAVRALRFALLSSVVPFAAPAALAQDASRPIASFDTPHVVSAPGTHAPITSIDEAHIAPPVSVIPAGITTIDEPQIVITPPNTPTTARDPNDITGVGQMVIANPNADGSFGLGLCTGTLVNPRMVIFAAHCVNTRPQTAYGVQTGDTRMSFGFKADNLPAIREWLFGNPTNGLAAFRSSPGNALYNVNQVRYLEGSLTPKNLGFLQADVAIASLDAPAADIPAWALLFSALPAPTSINAATGTGYHVTVTGYGRNGISTTGDTGGIDYRRRVAENYLGALTSLGDVDRFLYGASSRDLEQNLYMTDNDDPRRGTAAASPFDFNLFRDNALPREGITAGGDSGGPLILDSTYSRPVVLGVLSGGTRYYAAQPSSSYGTSSFYQPLYLYWDWIVANNPYRYVSSNAGNANWNDASHWRTDLDPNYQILSSNRLVNGVPTTAGQGEAGSSGDFGELCFQTRTVAECYNLGTGNYTVNGASIGNIAPEPVDLAGPPLPGATIANGLPGATNFVPNNTNPNRATGAVARYFDVTLAATGTTTLDTAVTVDRLSLGGRGATLNVAAAGSLTSLIEINHLAGNAIVNGRVTTAGDYFLLAGMLSGTGRIDTPFMTSVTGAIMPATNGTIGTLTIGGNAILASGSQLWIDIGSNGASDRLAVVGTTTTNGRINVGGSVIFTPVAGSTVRFNDVYTIVTAERGVTGTFAAPGSLSAILRPVLTYNATSVTARIEAGRYADVVDNTPVQTAYARLLDQNRTNYAAVSEAFGILDLQNATTIRTSLEGLAPRAETAKRAIGTAAIDNVARFYRERLASIDPAEPLGGTLAMIGRPIQLAANAVAMPNQQQVMSDGGEVTMQEGALPENMSAFLAGGYIDGSSRSMPTAIPLGGRDRFDGFYIAGGIEGALSDTAVLGFGLSYSDVKGDATFGQRATGELVQGTLYGKLRAPQGFTLDAQFSAGLFRAETERQVALAATPFTLESRDNALAISTEVGASYLFGSSMLNIGPRVAVRASRIDFTPTVEQGGGPALRYDEDRYASLQARAGAVLDGSFGGFRPFASAYYVHDFEDRPGFFTANFAGGIGPSVAFAVAGQDRNWGEVGGGLAFGSERVEFSVSADTTFERSDVRNQSYRGTVRFRF